MVGNTPKRNTPASDCFSSLIISFTCAVCAKITRAWSIIFSPIAVGQTGCTVRSNNFTPNSSSNFWIIALNVGCVTRQYSAARAKWRNWSTAKIYSNCCIVIYQIRLSYRFLLCKDRNFQFDNKHFPPYLCSTEKKKTSINH